MGAARFAIEDVEAVDIDGAVTRNGGHGLILEIKPTWSLPDG
jgi:hypothetical protein